MNLNGEAGRVREGENELVAIVGAACRLPDAPNVAAFWDLLVEGRDAVGKIPVERFDIERWYDPTPRKADRIVSRAGGYLPDIDLFDADYFGMSAQEAIRMDPQHRLLLQTTWEAIDDAGIPTNLLAGSRTGVYTSCFVSDYWDMLRAAGANDLYSLVGAGPWQVPAGRISYELDLRGPSLGVDATCATSLLAVHLACQSLRSGESDLAIVGGVNLLLAPNLHLALSRAGVLSPTGLCQFGDRKADGYVRSEGCVAMVLKPLARAVADGDSIYATILGTAATNDGRTGGSPVAPGRESQRQMLELAYHNAGVSPGDIDYVEAHGTGTAVGDPTELSALTDVLRADRADGDRCLVGSAKSNIGHTEVAAGLVSLLKTALAIRNRVIPATLHLDKPSPVLEESGSPLELPTYTRPWPRRDRPALAGVSSFGLSGTNVHAVLTEPPARSERTVSAPPYLLPVSARDQAALAAVAAGYADLLDGPDAPDPLDVCFSAGVRRTHHEHRLAVVASDRRTLINGLRSIAEGTHDSSVIGGGTRASVITTTLPSLLAGLGAVYAQGGSVDWQRIHEGGRYVPLPAYPWQRRRYWADQLAG